MPKYLYLRFTSSQYSKGLIFQKWSLLVQVWFSKHQLCLRHVCTKCLFWITLLYCHIVEGGGCVDEWCTVTPPVARLCCLWVEFGCSHHPSPLVNWDFSWTANPGLKLNCVCCLPFPHHVLHRQNWHMKSPSYTSCFEISSAKGIQIIKTLREKKSDSSPFLFKSLLQFLLILTLHLTSQISQKLFTVGYIQLKFLIQTISDLQIKIWKNTGVSERFYITVCKSTAMYVLRRLNFSQGYKSNKRICWPKRNHKL